MSILVAPTESANARSTNAVTAMKQSNRLNESLKYDLMPRPKTFKNISIMKSTEKKVLALSTSSK